MSLKRTRIRRKPSRRSQRTDRRLLAWLHRPEAVCVAVEVGSCSRRCNNEQWPHRIEAAHLKPSGYGAKGMGMKTPDDCQVSMCWGHHDDWDQHTGDFRGWSEEQRQAHADLWIAETTAAYVAAGEQR